MNKIDPLRTQHAVPITAAELGLLHLDPALGAGNFAFKALAVSRDPDQPILHLAEPQVLAKGLRVTALSLRALTDHAEHWAQWYHRKGIRAQDVVGVYARDGLHQIVQFCALTRLGAVPAITNGAMPGEVATLHFRHLRVRGLVCTAEQQAALDPAYCSELAFCADLEQTALPRRAEPVRPFRHSAQDPVMITHSSGTTGRPKPVALAHGQWFHGIRDTIARQGGRTGERRLLALPASHNSSIAFIIHAVLDGSQVLVTASQSGDTAADAIERFRPQVVAGFPVTHVALALHHAGRRDFSSVTTWVNSGDAAHEKHIRLLVAEGHSLREGESVPGSTFIDGLGSSEMGHISFPILHTATSRTFGRCIGRPQSWVEARIFDAEGEPAPDGQVGRLGLRTPSITPGYWNDSELTARSKIDGFFLTGDLAYRDAQGRFYHVDRTSDVIPTAEGPCYSLLSEELLMLQDASVDDCIVSALPGAGGLMRPVAIVWSERGDPPAAAPLLPLFNAVLAAKRMPRLAAVASVSAEAIPRGITGKVLKRRLLELLAQVAAAPQEADWIRDFAAAPEPTPEPAAKPEGAPEPAHDAA